MVATLLVFSIIIGLIFSFLFSSSTMDYYKTDLSRRANVISRNFTAYLETSEEGSGRHNMGKGTNSGHMMGYRPFLSLIDDIAMTSVWIMDQDGAVLVESQEDKLEDLPLAYEDVVSKALQGKLTFYDDYSDQLSMKTLTVGAPIFNTDGQIIGAVLLYSPLEGMKATTQSGLNILILSTLIGLILSVILAIVFSLNFIRPLKKMNVTAQTLAEGDYSVKTGIILEDEIGDLARTLDFLSGKLDEASRESLRLEKSRQDFISNVSHELRTPVTVLRGSLEALKDQVVTSPDDVAKYHNQMLKEIISLQRLVDDLLSLTKLQNPDFKMEMASMNISELLSDVVRSIRQVALKKNISVELHNPYMVVQYEGDYGRLRQMLMVVLDNAVKFSRETSQIELSLSCAEKTCELSISNQGIGISKEELPYIFDRFHQASKEKSITGTGLGLAIAKEIAHRHEIKISVASDEDVKTTFTFSINNVNNQNADFNELI